MKGEFACCQKKKNTKNIHLRHNERLLPRLAQNAIHKQRRAGESKLAPLPAFIEAQPGKNRKQPLLAWSPPPPAQTKWPTSFYMQQK